MHITCSFFTSDSLLRYSLIKLCSFESIKLLFSLEILMVALRQLLTVFKSFCSDIGFSRKSNAPIFVASMAVSIVP